MKGLLVFSFLCMVSYFSSVAQHAAFHQDDSGVVSLRGRVVTAGSKTPLQKATILLLGSRDSSIAGHGLSDHGGYYKLYNVPPGSYIIAVSHIGYETQHLDKLVQNRKVSAFVPDLFELEKSRALLAGVSVAIQQPLTEFRNGKLIMNVEYLSTAAGGSVYDILEKAPYVSVSGNGTIRLNGKSQVQILVDGKPGFLPADQLSVLLKAMPANDISKIEIITNPSSKYEAASAAGIINIITKKSHGKGFNASLSGSFSVGFYPKFNGGFNANYKRGRMNLFASYVHNESRNTYYSYISREFVSSGGSRMDLSEDVQSRDRYDNVRIGMNYNVGSKATVVAGVRGYVYKSREADFNTTGTYLDFSPVSTLKTHGRLRDAYHSISEYAYFEYKPDTSGRKMSLDIDRIQFDNPEKGDYKTLYFNKSGLAFQPASQLKNEMTSGITITSLKADVELPLRDSVSLEAGVKVNIIQTDNVVRVDTFHTTGWVNNRAESNRFKYRENINAVYITLSKQFRAFTVRAGLRAENTRLNGKQVTIDSVFRRNFIDIFPTLSFEKSLNSRNILSFEFGRKIKRPGYDMLNPFTYYSDPYTLTKGNPYLLPQYAVNFGISYSYKDVLNTSLTYTLINNVFSRVSDLNHQTKVTEYNYVNLDALNELNLSVNTPLKLTKCWQAVVNLSASLTKLRSGNLFGGRLHRSMADASINATNTISIGKQTTVQVSGFYSSPTIDGFYRIRPIYSFSLAIKRTSKDKQASVTLGIRDMLKSHKYAGRGKYQAQDVAFYNSRDSRQVYVSINYKLGKAVAAIRNKSAASLEEAQRLKQ